jgi:RHS repeat-associated protein
MRRSFCLSALLGFAALNATKTPAGRTPSGRIFFISPSPTAPPFYTFDERGNVAERLDGNGNLLSADMYDAYASQSDPFGFGAQAGYYTDAETGLVLCGHRYYDPSTGRFLTRDPLGYAGGLDLYAYCGGNPVTQDDPSGFNPQHDGGDGWPGLHPNNPSAYFAPLRPRNLPSLDPHPPDTV